MLLFIGYSKTFPLEMAGGEDQMGNIVHTQKYQKIQKSITFKINIICRSNFCHFGKHIPIECFTNTKT